MHNHLLKEMKKMSEQDKRAARRETLRAMIEEFRKSFGRDPTPDEETALVVQLYSDQRAVEKAKRFNQLH